MANVDVKLGGETIFSQQVFPDIPAQTWGKVEIDLVSGLDGIDTAYFDEFLIMPDGNIEENVATFYYAGPLSLENMVYGADDVSILFLENISIDGDLADWESVESHPISLPVDGSVLDDDADFSANFKMAWDDEHLYMNLNVADNELINDATEKPWKRDAMEIAFNMVNLEKYTLIDLLNDNDEGKITIVYGDNKDSIANASGRRMDLIVIGEGFQVASIQTDTGWSAEFVIPFTDIAPDFEAGNDVMFQVATKLIDQDASGTEAWLTWGGKENINKSNADFPTVTLKGKIEAPDPIMVFFGEGTSIDGDLADWDGKLVTPIKNAQKNSIIDDNSDFSADFSASWDDEKLYLNVNIRDDELVNDDTEKPWNRDAVEIAFNMVNLEEYTLIDLLNDDDEGKITVVYGDNKDSIANASGRRMDLIVIGEGFEVVTMETDAGWALELQIPFADIAPAFIPGNAVPFQMAIKLIDRDSAGTDARLTWGGDVNINKSNEDFPTLTLQGKIVSPDPINLAYHEGISVDGDLAEWADMGATPINFAVNNSVIDSPEDFSADFKAAWDDEKFCLNVNISDTELVNDATQKPWNRDAVEVAFNMVNLEEYTLIDLLNDDDEGKVTIVYGDNKDSIANASGRRMDLINIGDGFEVSTMETDDGWALEMQIPFADIAPDFVPGNGVPFQLAMKLIDRDTDATDARITWGGNANINKSNEDFPTVTLHGLIAAPDPVDISFGSEIKVDGDLADWESFSITEISVPTPNSVIDNAGDFSADFRAAWDAQNLYVNVNISDSELVNDANEKPWNRDAVEIAFNMVNLEEYTLIDQLNDDDEGKVTVVYDDNKDSIANGSGRRMDLIVIGDGFEVSTFETGSGWALEMKIPFADIATDFVAENGTKFQMAMKLIDRDATATDARLTWGGYDNINKSNADFPSLTLVGPTSVSIPRETSLSVFPNPVRGKNLYVSWKQEDAKGRLTLYTMTGQEVHTSFLQLHKDGTSRVVLPTGISEGIYILRIRSGKMVLSERIIVK
jgi:hypothetical protein